MKVRIADDGILMKTVNGKEWPVNCSQSHHAGRIKCGIDCSHCNEGVEQQVDQKGNLLRSRFVIGITCTPQTTLLVLEPPLIQQVPPGTILKEN